MMTLIGSKLTVEIPNSECKESNSLNDKNLKSSVGEFYISTKKAIVDSITNFIGINNNNEVRAKIDDKYLNKYFDEIEENIEPYAVLFTDELANYHLCIKQFYEGKELLIKEISFVLSKVNKIIRASKYLNIPKTTNSNKAFYGLLLGEISNLIIEKRNEELFVYPALRDDYKDVIQKYFRKNGKAQETNIGEESKLTKCDSPKNIRSYIVQDGSGGIDNTDYAQKAKNNIAIGKCGEDLVYKYEKELVGDKYDVKNVAKERRHYDIVSYDLVNNREKHIEVKTTRGDEKEPFYLSKKEYDYLCKDEKAYTKCIYRVYYARQKNPKFFVVDSEQIKNQVEYKLETTEFEVSKQGDE